MISNGRSDGKRPFHVTSMDQVGGLWLMVFGHWPSVDVLVRSSFIRGRLTALMKCLALETNPVPEQAERSNDSG